MRMYIYASRMRNYMGEFSPIVVETNLEFATPYWKKRKQTSPHLFWEFK